MAVAEAAVATRNVDLVTMDVVGRTCATLRVRDDVGFARVEREQTCHSTVASSVGFRPLGAVAAVCRSDRRSRRAMPVGRRLVAALLLAGVAWITRVQTPVCLNRWALVKPTASMAVGGEYRPALARSVMSHSADVSALSDALRQIDGLKSKTDGDGVVPGLGRRADTIVRRALSASKLQPGSRDEASFKELLDGPLKALFHEQLQTLRDRAVDKYEELVVARPNPYEAGEAALRFFIEGANASVPSGKDWSFTVELDDLMMLLSRNYRRDVELVKMRGKQSHGGQLTMEVIRKLQSQVASVRRDAETRGAFPWTVKWQYLVEKSPLGFRGQYAQGRSVVELLMTPDSRQRKSLLNRIGPLNLAVSFDTFL
eukprot:TRINITY_DN43295_c0_g1_i1.p1 TRINITY_DN43295_c0_g1~~TRINITY_DN43295_c0_g1_i1.p1  ORF type:complete len:418 (+),score=62.95 TRINITY_DN43295_c0_g1_i1:144-1256(+)